MIEFNFRPSTWAPISSVSTVAPTMESRRGAARQTHLSQTEALRGRDFGCRHAGKERLTAFQSSDTGYFFCCVSRNPGFHSENGGGA